MTHILLVLDLDFSTNSLQQQLCLSLPVVTVCAQPGLSVCTITVSLPQFSQSVKAVSLFRDRFLF